MARSLPLRGTRKQRRRVLSTRTGGAQGELTSGETTGARAAELRSSGPGRIVRRFGVRRTRLPLQLISVKAPCAGDRYCHEVRPEMRRTAGWLRARDRVGPTFQVGIRREGS